MQYPHSSTDTAVSYPRRRQDILIQRDVAFAAYGDVVRAIADQEFSPPEPTEIIMMLSDHGRLFHLNVVASYVWDLLDGSRSTAQIVDAVADTFAVSRVQACADVEALISELGVHGLVLAGSDRLNHPGRSQEDDFAV